MVVFQRKLFGSPAPLNPIADHTNKRRSLQSSTSVYDIQECSVHGRRPVVSMYVEKVSREWYEDDVVFKNASDTDKMWALMRLNPSSLSQPPTAESETQPVPGWSSFNAILYPDMPRESNVGYCPMIQGSSTEFNTVYTVLKHSQMITSSLGQEDTVITFDLLIYIKAKEIQWRFPEEFSGVVIRLGGFHIALNFLSLMGKKYINPVLDDLLIESGIYAPGTTLSLLKGKSYNRGVRAHKLTVEALFRLRWKVLVAWYNGACAESLDDEESVLHEIAAGASNVKTTENASQMVKNLQINLSGLTSMYEEFRLEASSKSKMFAFWEQYCDMVNILLQFIKAERTGNWRLHLSSVVNMLPHFFSLDRPNYARWLPVYLADMRQLEKEHPLVYKEFVEGNHSISRSGQPFSQVSTDMALEQSINADSKRKGGIVGISRNQGAVDRWFLTAHERAAVSTALKDVYGAQSHDEGLAHKEGRTQRIKRGEGDIKKLVNCFTSGLMVDPFSTGEENDALINFASGVVLPHEAAESLLTSAMKGQEQMTAFVDQIINLNTVSFWEPIKHLKVQTFTTLSKKIKLKASNEKIITINADRDLFGRLLIAANMRQINLKDVLRYELSPVPCSLAHNDGSLRKNTKSVLATIMEKYVDVLPRLPASSTTTIKIFDGMVIVQMVKSGGASTFGDLAQKYYDIFTSPLSCQNTNEIHVVFDQYWDFSIKAGERSRRGASTALEVQIGNSRTPVPKQWGKYITNPKNKINLCDFLSTSFCDMGQDRLSEGKRLFIGGGFKDGERAVIVTRGSYRDVRALTSNHEEADTRMLLHAKYASGPATRVVIQSPDTDVLILSVAHFESIGSDKLWFQTGVKDRLRYIPVHDISRGLGPGICSALPAFHASTGCDSNSALTGIGKKKAWDVFSRSNVHQETLSLLGQEADLDDTTAAKCESFICDLYPSMKRTTHSVDDLRYIMFCQKRQKSESLPPTSDSLRQHMNRANYQAYVWRCSLDAMPDLHSPENRGWIKEDGILRPVLMTKDPAPSSLLELTTCQCRRSECRTTCSCSNTGLACTESCVCMADETCQNPHGVQWQCPSDEYSDESDSE